MSRIKKIITLKEAKRAVKKYLELLRKENFPVENAYIFGSYARGDFKEFSDIDVCIISPKFRRNFIKNEQYLWRKTIEIDSRIEPIGYAPEDFDDALLGDVIREEGIRIV